MSLYVPHYIVSLRNYDVLLVGSPIEELKSWAIIYQS